MKMKLLLDKIDALSLDKCTTVCRVVGYPRGLVHLSMAGPSFDGKSISEILVDPKATELYVVHSFFKI